MSAASGKNKASTPAADNFSLSASSVRGYFAKSSFGPNCLGLTKMEAITGEQSRLARSTSATWPACSAPMVGTKPRMRLSARACRADSFIQAMVRIVSTKARGLCLGGDGALAIKMHQVGQDGLRAELPQQRGDLPAMIAAMVDEVLHRLPQRIAVGPKFQRLVFHYAVEIALRQTANEGQQARLEFAPAFAQACDVGILRGVWKRRRRAALKAFEPNPLRTEDVRQRVAHRRKAGAHGLGELLRRERRGRTQRAAIGPGVVVVQHANFFRRHRSPSQLVFAARASKWKYEPACLCLSSPTNPNDRTRCPTGSRRCARLGNSRARRWK